VGVVMEGVGGMCTWEISGVGGAGRALDRSRFLYTILCPGGGEARLKEEH
jgi:hypothetical protein